MHKSAFILAAAFLLSAASQSIAREVKVMFGLTIPPYVIKEENAGFELEIIREALAEKGHTMKPVYAALALKKKMLDDKQVDGLQHGLPEMEDGKDYFYAKKPAVTYQDVAITLRKSNIEIKAVNDLKGRQIVAYQTATTFIGPEFAAAVKGNPAYQETTNQKRQPLMLYAGGTQIVVSDINIFRFYREQVKNDVDISQEVSIHRIFPGSDVSRANYPVFNDRQIRDDFDAGLAALRASGKYQQIIGKYIKD